MFIFIVTINLAYEVAIFYLKYIKLNFDGIFFWRVIIIVFLIKDTKDWV